MIEAWPSIPAVIVYPDDEERILIPEQPIGPSAA
jgi:hypothetical protein